MDFEWDYNKARTNLKKHCIDFADAVAVFEDESAMTIPDSHKLEDRYVTMATDSLGRVLVVAYTWRKDRIRIISARKAGRSEMREYFSNVRSFNKGT